MTREEAIRLIGWLKCTTNREDDLEAIDMAIEALSAEAQAKCIAEIKVDAEDIYTRITGLVADKVDVVRCKDCRHAYYADNRVLHEKTWVCERFMNEEITNNDFCSWGERREE